MATRRQFSKDDTIHLADWLARNNPEGEGRRGNKLYKQLMEDTEAHPWNKRHTWQSWRDKYTENIQHFDALIKKRVETIKQQKPAPLPSPRRLQTTRDIKSLADYFAAKGIQEAIRHRADIFQELRHSDDTKAWARTRSAIEWRDLYVQHKEEVDGMVLELTGVNVDGPANSMDVPPKTGKRPRDETEPTRREDQNGAKKRRIEASPRPDAPIVPTAPTPITNGPEPLTPPPDVDPVVFVPGTPPSHQPTPVARAKPLPNDKPSNGLGPAIMPKASVLKAIMSGMDKAKLGHYGVPGSPLGSQVPPGSSPDTKSVPKPNSVNIPKSIFPQSLPSLTPALREKTMSRETVVTPRQGNAANAEAEDTTPNAGNVPRRSQMTRGGSIFAQVGQETPRHAEDHPRQEIFPHTLPHLTPTLRPGPHGENEYIINDDTVVFTSQTEHEDNGDALFPSSVPNLTPALRPGPHGETNYIIRDDTIQFLEMPTVRIGTPDQNALDDDEFEGPSPMPHLGSDRHSSRSFSFSHGDELIEGLAKAFPGHAPSEDADSHALLEIDELEDDDELSEKESQALPKKRPSPARSPMFASSSEDEAEPQGQRRGKQLLQVKTKKEGVRLPVKARPMAKTAAPSQGGGKAVGNLAKADTDSESDGSGTEKDSDKENEMIVDNKAPVNVNDVFNPSSPEDDAMSDRMAAATLQEMADETPDARSSPKSLHLSGKTPPSAETVANYIKPQPAAKIQRPATAPPLSKGAAAILDRYGKPVLDLGSHDRTKSSSLKAALSYPSPNIPTALEEALKKMEEPSPLQRLAQKAIDRVKAALSDGNVSDSAQPRQHGKVRFDGVAIDRERRKTTGGIGSTFATGRGIVSDAVAGPSSSRFKAAPAIFGSQRRSSGTASQGIHLDRKKETIIDLDDDESEEESPLARYTAHGTSSPRKSIQDKSDRNRRSSSHGPLQHGRSASGKHLPPPPSIQVPIYPSSSSPLPHSSPPARGTDRRGVPGPTVVRGLETEATWSPLRFGQPPASRADSGTIPSIGFRDQERDAAWVSAVHQRPSITSMRITSRGRNAPIPSDGDQVVYSSRSPSRGRSARRSTMGGSEHSGVDGLSLISHADRERIRDWLEENRNPDVSMEPEEEEQDDEDEAAKIFEGLGLMFEAMAAEHGFIPSVPRMVWKRCGDLSETAVIIQGMTDAANAHGLEALEVREQRQLQEIIASREEEMESREAMLAKEVVGRRKSGRYSSRSVADTTSLVSESGGGRVGAGNGSRADRSRSVGGRSNGTASRPRPPNYVPAEVIEPLLSQL